VTPGTDTDPVQEPRRWLQVLRQPS